jgi:hypothetical protein
VALSVAAGCEDQAAAHRRELVTLAMMLAMLGFTSETRWLRHARTHLRHLFRYLPQQPGYNKRLREAADLLRHIARILATNTSMWSDDVWSVDSAPVECGRSRETVKRSDLLLQLTVLAVTGGWVCRCPGDGWGPCRGSGMGR